MTMNSVKDKPSRLQKRSSHPQRQQQAHMNQHTPPHDIEAEKAVLGCLLLHPQSRKLVSTISSNSFYTDRHKAIWEAMEQVWKRGEVPEVMNCSDLLDPALFPRSSSMVYLSTLADSLPTTALFHTYIERIEAKRKLRDLLTISLETIEEIYHTHDANGCLAAAEKNVMALRSDTAKNVATAKEGILSAMQLLDARLGGESTMIDVPWGGARRLVSFLGGRLILLAARPGVGKTALALNLVQHNAKRGRKILFCSMEMTKEELVLRMVSSVSGVPLSGAVERGEPLANHQWPRVAETSRDIASWPLWIEDSGRLNGSELAAKARQVASREEGLDMIVVDYLQLIKGEGRENSRQEVVEEFAYNLKDLAKELSVPVLALSQLNRDIEKRKDPTPRMSDLRDSGALEQAADVILFLHRKQLDENTLDDNAYLINGKYRAGSGGSTLLRFDGKTQTFSEDWSDLHD